MQILIVDDDPHARRLLALNLAHAGHAVVEAEDGRHAWALFQQERYRLIITDWMMPNLNGLQLIQNIRAAQAAGYTYILMLTALDARPDRLAGLASGADDYLTKPFDPDELLARLTIGARVLQLEDSLLASRRQMEILALTDTLTGLFNRRAIHDRALAELNRLARGTASFPLSVILLDVDHFKDINDRHGHEAGDRTLRRVAELLDGLLRSYDVGGRWGGEEFLMLLPGATAAEAAAAAERIRAKLAETLLPLPGADERLSASLGVATLDAAAAITGARPTDSQADEAWLDQLVRAADQALYTSKRAGRNRVTLAAPLAARPHD
ncbi:MAG: diguanylate cyclase [Anaerolineales bacterium]|nr:diguanylate cyclase [Anaerolineales bacterium]